MFSGPDHLKCLQLQRSQVMMSTHSDIDTHTYTNRLVWELLCYQLNITVPSSLCEVAALRKEVNELVEVTQKLVAEFRAVKIELEATRLDVDYVRVALCELMASKPSS